MANEKGRRHLRAVAAQHKSQSRLREVTVDDVIMDLLDLFGTCVSSQ
jgi:hypothetical protein